MRKGRCLVLAVSLLVAAGCGGGGSEPKVGGLYSVDDGEGAYRVAKVLAMDENGVHVRLYKNRFTQRIIEVDEGTLALGTINDPDGFGMGHLPVSRKTFAGWKPVFIRQSTVSQEELEGYELWKEGGGAVFGE
jgi:hypothetical protein